MKQILTLMMIILVFFSCSLDNDDIRERSWKYGSGFHVGDWLKFDGKLYSLSNDTIYKNDTIAGVITKMTNGIFWDDNEIEVTSLKTDDVGIYHEK